MKLKKRSSQSDAALAKEKALPSREDILEFLAREQAEARASGKGNAGKIGKREIARAFDIKGADRIALKRMLRDLADEGKIESRRKHMHKAGELPPVVVCDIVARDADGELIAVPAEWDEDEHGAAPRIVVLARRKPRPGEPAPGVGDRALVRTEVDPDAKGKGPSHHGRVIKLLSRSRARTLGIFRATQSGARIIPVDKKALGREMQVAAGAEGGAEDGELVAVDVMKEGRFGLPRAKVRERIGRVDSEKAISLIAIHTHGIPNVFRNETIAEAERAKPATMKDREDWRALPLVTIDPADAKDHDDAVHAIPDDDPANEGGFILTVAIADVAAYVKPGSALDREAIERGNSVYFPDRVVPMLPERISNDLCSLRPLEDRPALAVRMIIARDGRKLRHTFHRIMMRSAAKLAYPQAQAAIDGRTDETTEPLLKPVLRPLWAAYDALKTARDQRHPLDLDLPERKILLKENGAVDRVIVPPRLDAHRLIEEFMILANVAAAETLEQKSQPLIYRAHDEPSLEKLRALGEFLATIGIKLAKGQALRPEQFNGILARVKGTEHENVVNEVVLRSQAQAEYVSENYGHFGLNLRRYAHFTSPIRRYADLIVHRGLVRALRLGEGGLPDMESGELAEIAARISAAERRAMAAERETTDRLIATHLKDQIGAEFEARISGVTRAGLFVKLNETGADGFVPASTLGRERFVYDETIHAMASRMGETYRLGDHVTVRLLEVAPLAGALRFEMVSEGTKRRVRVSAAAKPHKLIRNLGKKRRPAKGRKSR
jgi:ribonuclease R